MTYVRGENAWRRWQVKLGNVKRLVEQVGGI
jgi:hypothetical protein